jgi:hypothetical protein
MKLNIMNIIAIAKYKSCEKSLLTAGFNRG